MLDRDDGDGTKKGKKVMSYVYRNINKTNTQEARKL